MYNVPFECLEYRYFVIYLTLDSDSLCANFLAHIWIIKMNDLTKIGSLTRGNFCISDIHYIIILMNHDIILISFKSYDHFTSWRPPWLNYEQSDWKYIALFNSRWFSSLESDICVKTYTNHSNDFTWTDALIRQLNQNKEKYKFGLA